MKLTHEEIMERLTDYLEGWLTEAESAEIKSHLDQCESCRKEYESYLQLTRELDEIPLAEPPLNLKTAVMAKIEAEPGFSSWEYRFMPWFKGMAFSYLAGFIVVAITGYLSKGYLATVKLPTLAEIFSKSLVTGAKAIAWLEQFSEAAIRLMLDFWPLMGSVLTVNLLLLVMMAAWFHNKKEKGYFGFFII